MFKDIKVHATLNERTGYGIHGSRFFGALKDVCAKQGGKSGEVSISLLDTVSASNLKEFPQKPSILYNVWESTEQPAAFIQNLAHYSQLWVASEWQRACSIAQGIPEEFVKVVPEGVDPDVYKPNRTRGFEGPFVFVHVGQWQPRKSTLEIIKAYLKAFPLESDLEGKKTQLQLSVDTLFHHDQCKTTEERLAAHGINDPRIRIIHFEERDEYIRRLQNADCFVTCARSEGWNLPLCFPPNTGVLTPNGNKAIATIKIGDSVFTHTGESHKVLETMERHYCGDLSKIFVYGDNEPIICTPEHPLFVIKRPTKRYKKTRFCDVAKITPEWVEAKDVKKGDLVVKAIPNKIFNNSLIDMAEFDAKLRHDNNYVWYPTGFNGNGEQCKYNRYVSLNDLSFLFGWYIAEGCDNQGAALDFSLHAKEEYIAQEIIRQFSLYFNAQGKYRIDGNKLHLRINSTLLSSFFVEKCGKGAENKKIPNELLYGDTNTLKELISAYVDGDGHRRGALVSITTVSKPLARQIMVAIARLGHNPNIQNRGKRNGNYDQYVVAWNENNKNNMHSNKQWRSRYGIAMLVKSVGSEKYEGTVHNVEVEKDNSYLLCNASAHNCEAMACGVICTTSAFGGSTEYAEEALNIRIKELKKVEGIYGGWDCPGQWAEPDYEHLVEVLKDAYSNFETHRKKALKTSEMIRTKFTWKAAAEKAYAILEGLYKETYSADSIDDVMLQAKKLGYEIKAINKINAVFSIDCHPSSPERVETLVETIKQVKKYGYPVLVVAHLPLQPSVIELCDYYIYDQKDILSGDDKPVYARTNQEGKQETVKASISCHALAGHHNVRNALDFCRGRFDWIYHMNSDAEIDLDEWISRVRASDKPIVAVRWENNKETFGGQIMAGKVEWLEKLFPRIATWEEFAAIFNDDRFCSERGYYKLAKKDVGLENIDFIEDIEIGNRFDQVDRDAWPDDVFSCHFIDGPFLEIGGLSRREYDITYSSSDGKVPYKVKQKPGMWSRPATKYYKDWVITATLNGEVKFQHKMDLKGKRVLISMGSKALGDTIAWIPYIEEFRKKHQCHVIWSGWWSELFDYPELEFVPPGSKVEQLYASYNIGCHDDQLDKNVTDWRTVTLQKVATDILGLEYVEIKPKMKLPKVEKGNYACFSEHSTMKPKLWNCDGAWQKVIDYVRDAGIEMVSISKEPTALKNVTAKNGKPIEETIKTLLGCQFYIGLGHGPSWLAWALNIPVVMISGFSAPWAEFHTDYRIINQNVCNSCFNRPEFKFDRGWEWCPANKNYECTREIKPEMVIAVIDKLITKGNKNASKKGNLPGNGKRQHKGAGEIRPSA